MQANYMKMLQSGNTTSSDDSAPASAEMSRRSSDYRAPMPSASYGLNGWEPLLDSANATLTTPMSEYHPTPMSEIFDDFPQLDMSPGEDTPYNDFLNTPVISDNNDFGMGFDLTAPLFGGSEPWVDSRPAASSAPKESDQDALAYIQQLLSPETPMSDTIAPSHLQYRRPSSSLSAQLATPNTSPALIDASSFAPLSRPQPTGTRPGVTPEKLLGPEAPTQPRKYQSPSSTSRKEAPAAFNRKRSRAVAFQGDDDEELPPLHANATDAEQVEYKRRQNTLAARKSRKRKLEHQLVTERKAEYFQRRSNHFETVARTVIAMWQEQTGRPYELPAFPEPEP